MEPDFSGWVTKANVLCSDGKTILTNAFQHQDKTQVPLVWAHGHDDVENVLGHVLLTNKPEGVWGDAFFNGTAKAVHAKGAVDHKDVNAMSIWANQLAMKGKQVMHGVIREVSLVLAGANPEAKIESIVIQHADGSRYEPEDEARILSGETIITHSADDDKKEDPPKTDDEKTVADVVATMDDEQKEVLHHLIGETIAITKEEAKGGKEEEKDDKAEHGNDKDKEKDIVHNIFEQQKATGAAPEKERHYVSHDEMKGIFSDMDKGATMSQAVEKYALAHGITDIDTLFPDATALENTPELLARRMEWVSVLWDGLHKSPFAKVKSFSADITEDEARAKGYITGTLKKEEFFTVAKRETTPTTVYKKQKLDRDDVLDITDFDLIAWLKAEMRLMLNEEIARAVLLGDGRDVSHADKISETNIRPIHSDHELFTTRVNVNLGDANSTPEEIIDAVIRNRRYWKGTGQPIFFTTEIYISQMLLVRDGVNRRIYRSVEEIATEMRVSKIVAVEVMEEYPDIIGIMVNPGDYNVGANRGGEISMFDDFDIDFNQYKYLIETRFSGALTKLKSALVLLKTASNSVLVTPNAPTFNVDMDEVTIVDTANVVYKNAAGVVINAAGSPYAVAPGATYEVHAEAAAGYHFENNQEDLWKFKNPASA